MDLRTAKNPPMRNRAENREEKQAGMVTAIGQLLLLFGWLKTVAGLRKTRHRGVARVGWMCTFALAAYNLARMRNLLHTPV